MKTTSSVTALAAAAPVSLTAPASVRRKKAYRRWHAWMGVISAVCMLLVAVTAILLEAPRSWRLGEITVPVSIVPGYAATGADRILTQVKCALTLADGTAYVGTRKGLFSVQAGRAAPVTELRGKDIFNLDLHECRLLVGTRESAWLRTPDGRWSMVADSRGAASFTADGRILFNRGADGLHVTADLGRTWTPLTEVNAALRAGPYPDRVTLSQLALDLHTGSALVGSRGVALYVYLVSAVLIALAISGFLIRPAYLRRKSETQFPATSS